MSEGADGESQIIDRASSILGYVDLTWEDLKNKVILDGGAGEAVLSQVAPLVGSSAKIYAADIHRRDNWAGLPFGVKGNVVQAVVQELPFADNTFDLIINNASIDGSGIIDEARVLKPGGEIRLSPIGGQMLDMWYVGYYLQVVKGMPNEEVIAKLAQFEQSIIDNDGWRPNEYADLEKASMETLTPDQKLDVIDLLIHAYTEMTGLPLSYVVRDPEAIEPNGYIVYKKPVD